MAVKENEKITSSVSCSNTTEIKQHLSDLSSSIKDEGVDEEQKAVALKLAKLLERKKRKLERIERKIINKARGKPAVSKKTQYENCKDCKNPKSLNCEHDMCRNCCKEKVFTQNIECKGLY